MMLKIKISSGFAARLQYLKKTIPGCGEWDLETFILYLAEIEAGKRLQDRPFRILEEGTKC